MDKFEGAKKPYRDINKLVYLGIDDIVSHIKNRPFMSGMTDEQRDTYFDEMKTLESLVKRLKKDAATGIDSEDILFLCALLIRKAFSIGTYKYPSVRGPGLSIFGAFPKYQSVGMSADDAAAMEEHDREFAKRRGELRALKMREKKAQSPSRIALVQAVIGIRGDAPSAHPSTEARRIRIRVGAALKADGHLEPSEHAIYRVLKKFNALQER